LAGSALLKHVCKLQRPLWQEFFSYKLFCSTALARFAVGPTDD